MSINQWFSILCFVLYIHCLVATCCKRKFYFENIWVTEIKWKLTTALSPIHQLWYWLFNFQRYHLDELSQITVLTFKSLYTVWCCCNFTLVILKLISRTHILSIFSEPALRWMPQHLTDDSPTSVQIMAWYRHATNYYLSQCWPRSMSPYGVTRP